ncbi:oxidoreductase [Nocardioides sp. zg-536]|uniref:Oxidoreductase n=1 Tax=Nocardioides faecalis TaxID=2803858 RepID=A0A939BWZ3_9ACTN|nr:oxidoreductase [Nocardioides faecalis]MBM9461142.1 oxidoreductase [Nocardioides faecalis]QVI58995.1 oxidoreductase [Nocardioides faecalis]
MSTDPFAWLISLEGVPSGFAGARDGIDVMLRDRGLRRTSPELTAESLLRGAHASAVLEGSASSLAQVRAGEGDEIARDAVRVATELLSLLPVLRRQPLQALARIHTLAARGVLPDEMLGRPRPGDSASRLRGIADLITAPTQAPALAVAAVVHAELVTAAPFGSHNGIVARATERLLLAAKGVDEKSLVVPEAAHLALRPAYESNLRGWADGGPAGMHSWLLYATEAYSAAAEASPLVRDAE